MKKTRSGEPLEIVTTSSRNYPAEDELCNLICEKYPEYFSAGTQAYCLLSFSFTNKKKKKMLDFVINYDLLKERRSKLNKEEKEKDKERARKLYKAGKMLAEANECQYWITYFKKTKKGDIQLYYSPEVTGSIPEDNKKIVEISKEDYMKKIYSILNVTGEAANDAGSDKEVNDHTSGSFQDWIRAKFSKKMVVCDIDAVFFNDHLAIPVEIKKIKEESSIEDWQSYVADVANYEQLESFVQKVGTNNFFLLITHHRGSCFEDTEVKSYSVAEVDGAKARECRDKQIKSTAYLKKHKGSDEYNYGTLIPVSDLIKFVTKWLDNH